MRFAIVGLVCSIALVATCVPASADNYVQFQVGRGDYDHNGTADLYQGMIQVELDDGATSVELISSGGKAEAFVLDGSQFTMSTGWVGSLSALNDEISGSFTLRITTDSGVSEYTYTIGAATESMFPNLPTLSSIPSDIASDYTFSWKWAGKANGMYAEASLEGGSYENSDNSLDGSFIVGDTSDWTPDFEDNAGEGSIQIVYANVANLTLSDGLLVSGWTLSAGDDLFGDGDFSVMEVVGSGDYAEFNVVPEPATLCLLGAGSLALTRRRKR